MAAPVRADPMPFSRANPSPRFKALQALYRQMHEEGARQQGLPPEKTFPGKSLYPHVKPIRQLVVATGSRSILDYGSGKGLQYKPQKIVIDGQHVADGIAEYWDVDEVRCYDPGHAPFAELPAGTFDGVICTDVLEHCSEEDLPWIVAELFGYARKFVYANVACFPAGKTLPNGENAHVTVRAPQWWKELFERRAAGGREVSWVLSVSEAVDGKGVETICRGGPQASLRLNVGCGDKPLDGYVNVDVAPSRAVQAAPAMPGDAYLRWYYDSAVWKGVAYRGVRTLKLVTDLWNYQEIFAQRRIEWVLETGTRHGGSALYFADLLTNIGAPGMVVTVDVDHRDLQAPLHPRLRMVLGDSTSEIVRAEVSSLIPRDRGALFVILDSDHRRDHVLREMEMYVPLMVPGDYLVVEDTCINGHPVRADFGPGPWEAVTEFLERHPSMLQWDRERETKFGGTFAPRGYFIRL